MIRDRAVVFTEAEKAEIVSFFQAFHDWRKREISQQRLSDLPVIDPPLSEKFLQFLESPCGQPACCAAEPPSEN